MRSGRPRCPQPGAASRRGRRRRWPIPCTRLLLLGGRVDVLDEPGLDVVDQAGHEPARRKSMPGHGGVDSHRRIRVADRLVLQLFCRDLEERGELIGVVREAGDTAISVVQDHQVPAPRGLALAKPAKQGPLAQRRRGDPPADVAHDDTFTELETEYITRVDPGVDAAEHLQGVAGRERKAGERPRRGERRVAPNQLTGRNAHVFGAYGTEIFYRDWAQASRLSSATAGRSR